jgi:Notch-like protein
MTRCRFVPHLLVLALGLSPLACGGGSTVSGLPVGSACTQGAQCAGPGVPDCLTDGLYPLAALASSQDPTAQGLAGIGVPLPGGYCSTVPPCTTDADCGLGGSCFFPLKNVDPAYFGLLVSALGLQPADAAVVEGFLAYGQCLQRCRNQADCTRTGYVCATPIDDFLALVEGADRSTYCIGQAPACEPACVHGTCDLQASPPACQCEPGWEGPLCDQDLDDCDPDPCQNGGTCTDRVNGYTCACPAGFTGPNCETAVQGCADAPCAHGTCEDTGPGTFTCTCEPGWQGVLCDQDEPDCLPNPCQNGGTCTEGAPGTGQFACQCAPGWEGALCEQNIDDCDPDPCQNGGTCLDRVNGYTCSCPAGFTGPQCEIAVQDCSDDPCVHGTCQDTGPGTYECTCEPGWEGVNCDLDIDDCDPDPCQHGGTCQDQLNGFACDCSTAPGWTGPLCDQDFPDCAADPCLHGVCLEGEPGTGQFSCQCEPGWEGFLCDQDIDDCDPDPCQHGGTCQDQLNGFACDCSTAPGWTGPLCDEPLPTTHCVLTYTLTRGNGSNGTDWTGCNLRIRDALAGNDTHAVGPGTLVLRVPSDGGQNPAAGVAEVLYYHLPQQFAQSTFGTTITTDVNAASPELGATDHTTAVALGTLALDGTPSIAWGACSYPAGHNSSNTSFTPDVEGTGPGCLAPYRSTGNVHCTGGFCSAGGLQTGDNPQDETWEQAMNELTFSAGLATFEMNTLMLVPNRSPSRTYLSWEGTLQGAPVCQ